jgi:MoaA/NifB/PqqE/SkfB family radical SAM enzyme
MSKNKTKMISAKGYNYMFDPNTGFTARCGNTKDEDPFMAPFPELADISINNVCDRGCNFCYKSSNMAGKTMSVEDYRKVMKAIPLTFQVALGGGEPTMHPDFVEILRITREEFDKVPNYTTNGTHLNARIIAATKTYCGAVAVSFSDRDDIWIEAVKHFINAGIKTNIHFVVSEKTVQTAINLLTELEITPDVLGLEGLNAIVFLLYKPVGRANENDILSTESAIRFLDIAFNQTTIQVGFDSCFVKHIRDAEIAGKIKVPWEMIDTCESSRFSVYISENLEVIPCSFGCGSAYSEDLRMKSFKEIWFGEKFEAFRRLLREDKFSCHMIEKRRDEITNIA